MNAFIDYFRQRQQRGSICTILAASIESSGVVDSLTEMPQPGQLQIKRVPVLHQMPPTQLNSSGGQAHACRIAFAPLAIVTNSTLFGGPTATVDSFTYQQNNLAMVTAQAATSQLWNRTSARSRRLYLPRVSSRVRTRYQRPWKVRNMVRNCTPFDHLFAFDLTSQLHSF
jgi:hypothetical protein